MLLKKKQIIQKFLVVCIGVGNVGDDVPDVAPRFLSTTSRHHLSFFSRWVEQGRRMRVSMPAHRIVLIDHFGLPSAIGLSGFPLQT